MCGDVMKIMRNRFEGTEFSPDETGRTDIRVIGTDTANLRHWGLKKRIIKLMGCRSSLLARGRKRHDAGDASGTQ